MKFAEGLFLNSNLHSLSTVTHSKSYELDKRKKINSDDLNKKSVSSICIWFWKRKDYPNALGGNFFKYFVVIAILISDIWEIVKLELNSHPFHSTGVIFLITVVWKKYFCVCKWAHSGMQFFCVLEKQLRI